MKGVLFIYCSYATYEGRIILFTGATLHMNGILFISWSYTIYVGRIIYLLVATLHMKGVLLISQLHRIRGTHYLLTAATMYMTAE